MCRHQRVEKDHRRSSETLSTQKNPCARRLIFGKGALNRTSPLDVVPDTNHVRYCFEPGRTGRAKSVRKPKDRLSSSCWGAHTISQAPLHSVDQGAHRRIETCRRLRPEQGSYPAGDASDSREIVLAFSAPVASSANLLEPAEIRPPAVFSAKRMPRKANLGRGRVHLALGDRFEARFLRQIQSRRRHDGSGNQFRLL